MFPSFMSRHAIGVFEHDADPDVTSHLPGDFGVRR